MYKDTEVILNLIKLANCEGNFQKFGDLIGEDRSRVSKYANGVTAIKFERFLTWCEKAKINPKDCF